MSFTASKLLAIAAAEIGYKEKESNSQLDNKTANAGDNNYTKYARDLHAAGYYQANKNGYAWCDMFVDWCFLQLTGSKEKGEYLECQTGLYGAGCEWSSDCYRRAGRFDKNPQPGDQIFFGKTDDEEHTGIVEKVENGKVYTIEGNASNQVKRCTYSLSSSYIVGYGHPRFDPEEATKPTPVVTGRPSTSADEKALWDRCKKMGMNDYGAAGTLANLFAECGLKSNNLQNTGNTKLDMTDEEYTAAVDSGAYTNFVRDSHGYGLCQWTYWSRKQALLDFVKAAGKSVGDWATQMDFMEKELAGYSGLMKILKTATSVKEASDAFMCQFERPADQSETAKAKRASYGQKYYDKYAVAAVTPAAPTTGSIVVDGKWGTATTTLLQKIFGTPVDGIVSNQWACYKAGNPGLCSGFDWKQKPNGQGSQLIKAMQKWANMPTSECDGEIGPKTIKAFQKKLGTTVDGKVSYPSAMVKALQKWANEQR